MKDMKDAKNKILMRIQALSFLVMGSAGLIQSLLNLAGVKMPSVLEVIWLLFELLALAGMVYSFVRLRNLREQGDGEKTEKSGTREDGEQNNV